MRRHILLLTGALLASVITVGTTIALARSYFSGVNSKTRTNCRPNATTHTMIIHDGTAMPAQVNAKRCDTLVITNDDAINREIAFGVHDHHQAYDGITEKQLRQHDSLKLVLSKSGNYVFHDHLHDEVHGDVYISY